MIADVLTQTILEKCERLGRRRSAMIIGFLALHAAVLLSYWISANGASLSQLWVPFSLSAGVCLIICVLSAEKQAAPSLVAENMRIDIAGLADFATDLYWETDVEGKVIAAGGRLMPTIAPDINLVIGQHYQSVVELSDAEMEKMLIALQTLQPYSDIHSTMKSPEGQSYAISLSATPRYNGDGHVTGYLGVGTDVTDRVRATRKLRHLAEHDMLTGLANRYLFATRIEKDLKMCPEGEGIALLAIDLDGFKNVNDLVGHDAGDAVLRVVAKRIRRHMRPIDWAARLGGDEFVVVSRHIDTAADIHAIVRRLQDALNKPYNIGGVEIDVKASIGIAINPSDANNAQSLHKCADAALYQAKADGKGCYRMFQNDERVAAI